MAKPVSYFLYEEEAEKASYAYLMTTLIVIIGLPMPIINVIGSVFFYFANRRKTYFVRFHCMQSMLSQLSVVPINLIAVSWTVVIITSDYSVTNYYIGYIMTVVAFNIIEFISSIYAAVQVRKRIDVRFWLFGALTERIYKPEKTEEQYA
jgi:uncharacterized membrane protein